MMQKIVICCSFSSGLLNLLRVSRFPSLSRYRSGFPPLLQHLGHSINAHAPGPGPRSRFPTELPGLPQARKGDSDSFPQKLGSPRAERVGVW